MGFRAGPYDDGIVSDGQQSLYRVTDGKETITEEVRYAFGKGHDGQTCIYRRNGRPRISYYTAIDKVDWTVGDALGRPPSLEVAMGRDISGDAVAMMPDLGGINNVRFQPYRLHNSRGHNPKDPRLACTACHNPHVDLQQDEASYDAKCTVCHVLNNAERAAAGRQSLEVDHPVPRAAGPKACPVGKQRCTGCHMPKVELRGAHFQFTDHRICIARQGEPYPY